MSRALRKAVAAQLWRRGMLSWKLHENQFAIYSVLRATVERLAVVLCARRFGKSFLGVLMALEDCLQRPGITVRIIGPEIAQTADIVHPLIEKISIDAPKGLVKRIKSQNRYRVGKSWLVIGGFDSKNIEKHRGKECEVLYIEEGGSSSAANYEYGLREVLGPQLLHSQGPVRHLTTPPKDPAHPFVTQTIPEAKLAGTFFKFTIYDNPRLSEEQIQQAIKDCGGVQSIAFRREYLCEIIRDERTVLVPSFDTKRHVKEFETPPHAFYHVFGDVGGHRDKTVLHLVAWDYRRAKLLFVDEVVCEAQTPTSVIVKGAKACEAERQVIPKSRVADYPGQLFADFEEHEYPIAPLFSKPDPEACLASLDLAFYEDKIEVHPRCRFTILSLESCRWNNRRTDYERTPLLGHADAVAAARYAWFLRDMSNPYPKVVHNPEDTFVRRGVNDEQQQLAEAFNVWAGKKGKKP